jgi:hypothetical protein
MQKTIENSFKILHRFLCDFELIWLSIFLGHFAKIKMFIPDTKMIRDFGHKLFVLEYIELHHNKETSVEPLLKM